MTESTLPLCPTLFLLALSRHDHCFHGRVPRQEAQDTTCGAPAIFVIFGLCSTVYNLVFFSTSHLVMSHSAGVWISAIWAWKHQHVIGRLSAKTCERKILEDRVPLQTKSHAHKKAISQTQLTAAAGLPRDVKCDFQGVPISAQHLFFLSIIF